jgi:hypothetical protein
MLPELNHISPQSYVGKHSYTQVNNDIINSKKHGREKSLRIDKQLYHLYRNQKDKSDLGSSNYIKGVPRKPYNLVGSDLELKGQSVINSRQINNSYHL